MRVPQNHSPFPEMTVGENIERGGYTLRSRALVASRLAAVEELFPQVADWRKKASGKTILLVEQNARAGLRMAGHGVVMENGRVRLTGTGAQVLDHPEIGALYLGGRPGPES